MVHRSRYLSTSLALLGALLLAACAPGASPITPTVTVPATAPPTALPGATPLPSSTPVPSTTPTPAPATATAPAPTATETPAPTATETPAASATPTLGLRGDPANGARLFASLPCSSCHDVTRPFPGGDICPNLGNIASEAERIVRLPEYRGRATNAAEYIRESILDPNAYIVPGEQYRTADGQSVMPKTFGQTLTPAEIDDLVAFLLQQK